MKLHRQNILPVHGSGNFFAIRGRRAAHAGVLDDRCKAVNKIHVFSIDRGQRRGQRRDDWGGQRGVQRRASGGVHPVPAHVRNLARTHGRKMVSPKAANAPGKNAKAHRTGGFIACGKEKLEAEAYTEIRLS